MASSAPSSLARHQPVMLLLVGAAAAYATYLVYFSTVHTSPPVEGLRRSNAIRRANPREPRPASIARVVERLQNDAQPLGDVDFFGHAVVLDPREVVPAFLLRELASRAEPGVDADLVQHRIAQLYDTLLDRFLASTFSGRRTTAVEGAAVAQWIGPQMAAHAGEGAIARALERYTTRFADTRPGPDRDGAESIAATDMSWRSDENTQGDAIDADSQTLQRTLYHIAEDRARQEGVIHRGITCNGCDTKPIRGIRWRCANCPDFDLCSDCEATNSHLKTHIFYKVRVPAPYLSLPKQESVYPGQPLMMPPSIPSALKKRLVSETQMQAEEIEALWDQFTCLATSEWPSDPNGIKWALDRRAFNHAFVPHFTNYLSTPNLIYDRAFAYFDTDRNTLIGVEEFIKGLDGLHSTDSLLKLRIVFNGYDVDGDGYISRKDVLRVFRAHYAMEREAMKNYLAETAEELSVRGALETIHSSQPLGSAFTQSIIPNGNRDNTRLQGKNSDSEPVIANDESDMMDRENVIRLAESDIGYELRRTADEAVHDRWARRQFYTDEEEGLTRPDGLNDGPSAPDMEGTEDDHVDEPPMPEHERPRGSRSSSRVRFQDDVEDIETRSNASTSSRPIGERWGGYEIPEAEKDLGKEVLYQLTQQAFNELINPLFREKEDNAMDAFNTRAERRACTAKIEEELTRFEKDRKIPTIIAQLGAFRYANAVLDIFCNSDLESLFEALKAIGDGSSPTIGSDTETAKHTIDLQFMMAEEELQRWAESWSNDRVVSDLDLWNAKLYRTQLRQELIDTMIGLGEQVGWIPPPLRSPEQSPFLPGSEHEEDSSDRDPTMPQFRPNSLADVQAESTASLNTDLPPNDASEAESTEMHSFGPIFVAAAQGLNPNDFNNADEAPKPSLPPPPPPPEDVVTISVNEALDLGLIVPQHHLSVSQIAHPVDDSLPPLPPPAEAPPPPDPAQAFKERRTYPLYRAYPNGHILHLMYITFDPLALHPLPPSPPLLDPTSPSALGSPKPPRGPPRLRSVARSVNDTPFVCGADCNSSRTLERYFRHEALARSESPLHIPFLASLEGVEKEIETRRGSGLLDYTEFRKGVVEGNLRFLECWLDWVSF